MEQKYCALPQKCTNDAARKMVSLVLALLTVLTALNLTLIMSGCSPKEKKEPAIKAVFEVWYLTDQYAEEYEPVYYDIYEGERMKKTGPFEPDVTERYRLKGVDFKGVNKPIEWDKLVKESGLTVTARGDMRDILDIMYAEYGDEPYPFDNFEIFQLDGDYYVYTRTYVSVHTFYRYDRDAKELIKLCEKDDVHIMRVIGLSGTER